MYKFLSKPLAVLAAISFLVLQAHGAHWLVNEVLEPEMPMLLTVIFAFFFSIPFGVFGAMIATIFMCLAEWLYWLYSKLHQSLSV